MLKSEYIPFRGGLNLTASATELPPGALIYSKNFEAPVDGGYRMIEGYERVIGQKIPSQADYWVIYFTTGSSEIVAGDAIVIADTGATAIVSTVVVSSGTWGGGNAAGYLCVTHLKGVSAAGSNITVGGSPYAVVNSTEGGAYYRGALTKALDSQYKKDAIYYLRDSVEGLGTHYGYQAVRGIAMFHEDIYILADDNFVDLQPTTLDGTATDADIEAVSHTGLSFVSYGGNSPIMVHVDSSVSGNDFICTDISSVDLSTRHGVMFKVRSSQYFAAGSWQILLDNTSACASPVYTVNMPELIPGKWVEASVSYDNTATGANAIISVGLKYISGMQSGLDCTLEIAQLRAGSGYFYRVGEGGSLTVYDSGRVPGGRGEFLVHNFGGNTGTTYLYFVDGKNKAAYFTGSTVTDITTGMGTDTPTHLAAYKNRLVLSFSGGSIQFSSAKDPTSWSVITGAGEIAIGEECTGFKTLKGQALAIFGRNKKNVLYGSSTADFNLVTLSETSGAIEWTIQDLSEPVFLDDRGLTSLSASDNYGDYVTATWSQQIQKIIDLKKAKTTCSCVSKSKSQYRIFFDDGTGLYCTIAGNQVVGIMPVDFGGNIVRGTWGGEDLSGEEVILFYTDSAFVYRMDSGNTFDGAPINAELRLSFNASTAPLKKKRYHRARFDVTADTDTTIQGKSVFSFGSKDIQENPWEDMLLSGEENSTIDVGYIAGSLDWYIQNLSYWSSKTSGSSATINAVVHNKKNMWLVVTESGEIITSPDGDTWTVQEDITPALNGAAYGNGYFVVVGDSGALYTSSDNGENWTQVAAAATAASSANLNDIEYFDGLWVAVGDSGTIITSSNLSSWTAQTSGVATNLKRVTHDGASLWGVCSAASSSRALTSLDGETWTLTATPSTSEDATAIQADLGGRWLIAVGTKIYETVDITDNTKWVKLFTVASASIPDLVHTKSHVMAFTASTAGPLSKLYVMFDRDTIIEKDISFNTADTSQSLKLGWDGGSRWVIGGASGALLANDLGNADVQYVTEAELSVQGNGKNISIFVRSNDADTKPYTLHGVNLLYSDRGVVR